MKRGVPFWLDIVKMAKSTDVINEMYSLAALFIYANKQKITKEKIMDLLSALDFQGQVKLAELFEFDVIKIKEMLSSMSNASSSSSPSTAQVSAAVEEKAPVEEEEAAEEIEIDFGDAF